MNKREFNYYSKNATSAAILKYYLKQFCATCLCTCV